MSDQLMRQLITLLDQVRMALSHDLNDPRHLADALVDQSLGMLDILAEQGIEVDWKAIA